MVTDIELGMIPLQLIDEGKRAREVYGDLRELIESFKAEGIIQPIAVKHSSFEVRTADGILHDGYLLLAGGRRYRAMKQMEIELVPCRIYPIDLTELEERSIELAENVNRLDLSWLEKIRLCEQIHNLQVAIHGEKTSTLPDAEGWSKRDTAKMLEKSPASIVQDIMLAEAVERIPELKECKTKDEARKLLSMMQETMIKAELARRIESTRGSTPTERIKLCDSFIISDFHKSIRSVPDGSIDIVEIDPPYAIDLPDLKKLEELREQKMSSYNEIPSEQYPSFIKQTVEQCYRVLTERGWLVMWFGPEPWFDFIYQALTQTGFKVKRIPGIWVKSTERKVGQTMQPGLHFGNSYEMFFYARKQYAELYEQGRSNVFDFKTVSHQKKVHPTERPIEMIEDILSIMVPPGSRVLVPFLGSGNTLLAASNLGMQAFGYELSQEYKDSFILRVHEGTFGRYNSYD